MDFADEAAQTFAVLGHRTDGSDVVIDELVVGAKLAVMTCALCGHLFTYDSNTRKVLGGADDRPFVMQTCLKTVPSS